MAVRRPSRWQIALLVLSVALVSAPAARAADPLAPPGDLNDGAGIESQRLPMTVSLPITGRVIQVHKLVDADGNVVEVATDELGRAVDLGRLVAEEERAYRSRHGALDPSLAASLRGRGQGDRVRVAIFVKVPEPPNGQESSGGDLTHPSPAAASDLRPTDPSRASAAAERRHADIVRERVDGVIGRLRSIGVRANRHGLGAVLTATLDVQTTRRVARWTDVLAISAVDQAKPTGDLAEIVRRTVGADVLQDLGITGAGTKVAQVEVGGRVTTQNPFLTGVVADPNASLCYLSAAPSHGTAVAGIVRYLATGTTLWATGSCTGSAQALADRASAAVAWGAAFSNHSYGEVRFDGQGNDIGADRFLNSMDRYLDTIVFDDRRLQIVAAGNDGQTSGNVASPGAAYNVLTVGNFNDRGTVAWTDDWMHPSSSYRDPASLNGDREKPEIAAPGTGIIGPTISEPWWELVGTGTSFAAPVITGLAAQLLQRRPDLVDWPVATKAILMATAVNNIEGSAGLSERDGAGGPWGPYADAIARGVGGGWAAYNWSCTPSTQNLRTITLKAFKRTRVVLAFNTNPRYRQYESRPSADYDLIIRGPTGERVAASLSFDNTYEIVDFRPPTAGSYKIRVVKHRCDLGPRTLAIAWWSAP